MTNQDIINFYEKTSYNKINNCQEWQGSLDTSGYGLYRFKRKLYKAHRFIFKILNIEIPEGHIIMHLCDNTKCVKRSHLKIGTSKENAQDRDTKGRSNLRTRENNHGQTKLSFKDVQDIIIMAKLGKSGLQISKMYPVCHGTICSIIRRYKNA